MSDNKMKRSEYISRKNMDESFQVDADKAPCGSEAQWPAGHHAVVLPHPAPPYTLHFVVSYHHLHCQQHPNGWPRTQCKQAVQTHCLVGMTPRSDGLSHCMVQHPPKWTPQTFLDSSQAAWEEGQTKETNSQSKKAIYIKLTQAIFLHDELIKYHNLCQEDPSQFVPATEQCIPL